jgi:ABC transport system ATP-binding/permease protein
VGYLQDFLFPPGKTMQPVSSLSGGEQNRVMLAKFFSKPGNVLVLDEPTNDLDVETLELLEELLTDYDGTLLLVSHDRAFLDNVVTSMLVFDAGKIHPVVGGYADWLRFKDSQPKPAVVATKPSVPSVKPEKKPGKRSYNEQRELSRLPEKIEKLETEIADLQQQLADPALYQQERGDKVAELNQQLQDREEKLEACYVRWEELEG